MSNAWTHWREISKTKDSWTMDQETVCKLNDEVASLGHRFAELEKGWICTQRQNEELRAGNRVWIRNDENGRWDDTGHYDFSWAIQA